MKNQTFEPGPWILGGCSGRMITTPDGYVGDGFIADVDTLANARLIAAAPELLEALQEVVASIKITLRVGRDRILDLGGSCDSVDVMIKEHSEIARAEAAIAKALGQ